MGATRSAPPRDPLPSRAVKAEGITAFRSVPRTGVIFVTTEAVRRGYDGHDPRWCNLGQGQPETGLLEGAPPRIEGISLSILQKIQ